MNLSTDTRHDSLLKFTTGDPDEFAERISGIAAPGLKCGALRSRDILMDICAAKLPGMGIFSSTLQNFRVQSPRRPFYALTLPLAGSIQFLVEGSFENYHNGNGHLQHPEKTFDAKVEGSPIESLQLCFDQAAMNSFASRMQGCENRDVTMTATLDKARPEVQSLARHATFVWSEILRGGAIHSSSMIAQESVHLLQALLFSATNTTAESPKSPREMRNPAGVRRAEEYVVANLTNPVSIADVASVAGMSARNLSREFRRHRGSTIKEFIRDRRLEAANQALLTAEPRQTTVSMVAIDFGFEQLGRFSRDYKNAFGELPSETLAR